MKFGLTHRILTSALAALGVIALVSSGALPKVSTAALLVGLVAALLATERFQQSSTARYAMMIVPSTLLGVEFLRMVITGWHLEYAVEFAAGLQIVRLATRRGASHDQQVILLALLHLVAGTVLGGGITYGLCLFGFLVLAPGALVLSHLRREVEGNYRQGARDHTGLPVDVPRILRSRRVIGPGFLAMTCLLSLPILLFTSLLFVAFPRVGLSLLLLSHDRNTRVIGFSDQVDLGQVGKLRDDPRIVLRIRRDAPGEPPPRLGIKLRGTTFDEYRANGQWNRRGGGKDQAPLARAGSDVPITRFPDPARDVSYRMELEPIDPTVLFVPPRTVAIRWGNSGETTKPPPVTREPENTLHYAGTVDHVLRYEAFVARDGEVVEEPLSDEQRRNYLQVPTELPPRIRKLAEDWTRGASNDRQKAALIQEHLIRDFAYSTDAPSGGKPNPIDDFLFVSKAGHCEFFSTAMAVMLRTVHVPSRNVTGYSGGTYNRWGGFYAVRQGDAHSWVEVWVDGRGWMTFDPTPPAGLMPLGSSGGFWSTMREIFEAISQRWDRYVVNYDLPTQMRVYDWMRKAFAPKNQAAEKKLSNFGELFGKRFFIGLGVTLVVGAIAWQLWRRRKRLRPADEVSAKRARQDRAATQLWLELEEVLTILGASRPRHIPPLKFVEDLANERQEELTHELLLLTLRYADARFGDEPLGDEEASELSRRVATLRKTAQMMARTAA